MTVAEDLADQLRDEFQRHFPRSVAENLQTDLIRNLFRCEVGTDEEAFQEQFLEFYHESTVKDEYRNVELERLRLSFSVFYTKVGRNEMAFLEAGISVLDSVKKK